MSDSTKETHSFSVSATVNFDELVVAGDSSLAEHPETDGFRQGARWSLLKLAAWLETKNIVVDDDEAQRTVDQTKALIALQAKQVAASFRESPPRKAK